MKPAPAKVEALKKMSPPKNAGEVRSLLGMAQYSAQFISRFSKIIVPQRMLTHMITRTVNGSGQVKGNNPSKRCKVHYRANLY